MSLAVHPGWWGEGVGKALHDHVLSQVGSAVVVAWGGRRGPEVLAWFQRRGWRAVDQGWLPSAVRLFEYTATVVSAIKLQ